MKILPLIFALVVMVVVAGCTQLNSLGDGFTGAPLAPDDLPAWYHAGQLLAPVLHAILALFRDLFFG